jgi:hypothetical protein
MTFIQYITLILLSLEPSYGDKEPWDVRAERMEIIAQAIDDASSQATCSDSYAISSCQKIWSKSKKDLALLLVTKGFWESRFAKNVHEGKCAPTECDAVVVSGAVHHRARSPWQIQRAPSLVSESEYKLMNSASLEGTKTSANVATRYLAMGLKTCHTIKGAISMYGGAGCEWEGTIGRYNFFNSIRSKSEDDFKKDVEKRKAALEARLARDAKLKSTAK